MLAMRVACRSIRKRLARCISDLKSQIYFFFDFSGARAQIHPDAHTFPPPPPPSSHVNNKKTYLLKLICPVLVTVDGLCDGG